MKTEHDIQNEIRLHLSENGYFTERINVGEGFLINSRIMQQIKNVCPSLKTQLEKIAYFKTGAVKGRSDLSAIKDGKIVFLEIKNEVGKISEEQSNFIKQMKKRGCIAGVVRSVEDVDKLLNCEKETDFLSNCLKYTETYRKNVEQENLRVKFVGSYFANYDHYEEIVEIIEGDSISTIAGVIYGNSYKTIENAIKVVGEDNFIKYVLKIEGE